MNQCQPIKITEFSIDFTGWSGRALTQRRPRVSKLGLKGLPDYYYNEIAVKAARGEASGANIKGLLSLNIYSKREMDNYSAPN